MASCEAQDDQACARQLVDDRYWSAVYSRAQNNPSIFESACRGGLGKACTALEMEENSASYDDVSTKRMFAAYEELEDLEKRWLKQLETLSELKCATGEQAMIPTEWKKGAAGRKAELAKLDAVAAEVGSSAVMGDQWSSTRERLDLVIAAGERAAADCKLSAR